jgi:hypothetical protein
MYLIKLKQAAGTLIGDLAGKSYTVGKVTTVGNSASNVLVLQPQAGSAAAAAKGSVILKVEGSRQLAGLAGKTVVVGKSNIVGAGAGKWLALYPSAAAKGAVAGTGGATAILAAAPATKGAVAAKGATTAAGTGATAMAAAKTSAAGGTIWNGTGMSLGLGLGLGAMGPALLAGAVAAGGYYLYKRGQENVSDEGIADDLAEAVT